MPRIEFKNLPDTSTPINAENLNAIQENVVDLSDSLVLVNDDFEILDKKFVKINDNIYILKTNIRVVRDLTVGPRLIYSFPQEYAPLIVNNNASLTGNNNLVRIFIESTGNVSMYNLQQLQPAEYITINTLWFK